LMAATARTRPTPCATTKPSTSTGAMPANVLVNGRPIVTEFEPDLIG
jgi:hypothetical protein